jgi:hypothetical protein
LCSETYEPEKFFIETYEPEKFFIETYEPEKFFKLLWMRLWTLI